MHTTNPAGGNFWRGARQGLITAILNHLGHSVFPTRKGKYNAEFYSDGDGDFIWNAEKGSWEWYKPHKNGYTLYNGQYEISLVEQGWDYASDNYISPIMEGTQIIGAIFKGAFYDLPKEIVKQGRTTHIRTGRDGLGIYKFIDGRLELMTLPDNMTHQQKMEQLALPVFTTLTAPIGLGIKFTSSTLLNFGLNSYLKSSLIELVKSIEQN